MCGEISLLRILHPRSNEINKENFSFKDPPLILRAARHGI